MSRHAPWILSAILACSCAWQGFALLGGGSGFTTLPILVPASLEHEQAMRQARGQPPSRGGERAVAIARALERESGLDPALAAPLTRVRDLRLALLDARGRRHDLNIALMDVGVAVARELTPAQWEVVQARRDAVRAAADAATFERVRARLGGAR